MKTILLVLMLFVSIGSFAQNKNASSGREALFNSPFELKHQMQNPQQEAGKMLVKSSSWKTAAIGCVAVSSGVWLFNKDAKNKKAIKTVSIVSGASAIVCYMIGLRFEWTAGKYLRMSASPGEVTASIKF